MKRKLTLVCMLAPFSALATPPGASQPLPTPFPEMRYRQMSARSPFAVPASTAPVTATTPDFAAQLYVDGVAHFGQTDYVAIKSRDLSKPLVEFVSVGNTTYDGIKVERVTWSDNLGKSTVDVRKGAEKATLVFDQAAVASLPPITPGNQRVFPYFQRRMPPAQAALRRRMAMPGP
jgi:hypothetical protein